MATTQAVQREMVKLSALRPGDEITLTVEWPGELATSQKDGWPDQYKWKFEGNKIAFLSIAQNRMLEDANAVKGDTFTIRKIENKSGNRKGVFYEAIKHGEEPNPVETPQPRQRYDDPKDRPADKFTASRCEWCGEFSIAPVCNACTRKAAEEQAARIVAASRPAQAVTKVTHADLVAAQRTATAAKQVQPEAQPESVPATRKPPTNETIGSRPPSQHEALYHSLVTAIETMAAAEQYAKSIGYAIHFEGEQVQKFATTLFLETSRSGGLRHAA